MPKLDLDALIANAKPNARYQKQLARLTAEGIPTEQIEAAVDPTLVHVASGTSSLVIYGEPQSGKTEMMICLTAQLLDKGFSTIIHLLNDSVDLHGQI